MLNPIDWISHATSLLVGEVQTWVFVTLVQPVLYHFQFMVDDDFAYDGVLWFLAGLLQIAVVYAVLRPLEALRPLEIWPNRRAVRVDVLYTFINRLGLINLALFFTLQPVSDSLQEWLRLLGVDNINLDTLWPGVTDKPLVAFLIYFIVLDFAGYWYHRAQHQIQWWWELHAVHHSQRQLSLWSDDRNHLLDDVLQATFFAALALMIGVPPTQFVALSLVSGALQSLQHANTRLSFGWLGERLLVSPRFHRLHHAVGYGHELGHQNNARLYGCNFGVLLPWWDVLFRSADFNTALQPTGVRAQLPAPDGQGEDYGDGFWAQQWLGLVRMLRRLTGSSGKPGSESPAGGRTA